MSIGFFGASRNIELNWEVDSSPTVHPIGGVMDIDQILGEYGDEIRHIIETPDISFVTVVAKVCTARDETKKQIIALFDVEAIKREERERIIKKLWKSHYISPDKKPRVINGISKR